MAEGSASWPALHSIADTQPAAVFYVLAIPASFIAWGHNIATAVYVRDMMREFTGGAYVGRYGNAVWLTLAGTVSIRARRASLVLAARPSGRAALRLAEKSENSRAQHPRS